MTASSVHAPLRPAERASRRFSSTVRRANKRRPSGTSATPKRGARVRTSRADILALEGDPARRKSVRAGDGAQKRSLAGSVRANERNRLRFVDAEANAAHGLKLAMACLEPFD